jgi:hypothetical protein
VTVTRGIKKFQEKIDNPYGDSGSKIKYFTSDIKDKQVVTVWFLDDFDEGSPAADAGAGIAAHITEHKAGTNFKIRAQCTMEDEGRCYGCEQAIAHPKTQWGKTGRVYANVLVDNGKGDDLYVAVWSLATNRSPACWDVLLEEYLDNGSIAAGPWRVRRSGEGTNTAWSVKKLDGDPADFAKWDSEKFDLEKVSVTLPYDEQKAHYTRGSENTAQRPDVTEEW